MSALLRRPACAWLPSAVLLFFACGLLIPSAAPAAAAAEGMRIQFFIDQAESGSVVSVPAGNYEGSFVIDKPLRLVADGRVTVTGSGEGPVVRIAAEGSALEGFHLVHVAGADDSAAVLVTAGHNTLQGLDIRTGAYGILLRQADDNVLTGNSIRPLPEEEEAQAKSRRLRNGIDLFESHGNRIENNAISGMNDGIYLESSDRNIVRDNRVDHSRYGIHGMFAAGLSVQGNYGNANTTGAMIMGVDDAEVIGNTFVKMSESVNSQGILLFDVNTSRIADNLVEGNRVGLYVEQSSRNEFRNNRVLRNFVGAQLLESEDNHFEANDFVGNVIDAEATDSANNRLTRNYWDAFRGIDPDGDGASNLRYAINPFFQRLTASVPAYQLFFHAPGMQFLESMFASGQADWTYDEQPLMRPVFRDGQDQGDAGKGKTIALASIMLAGSLMTITYFGGRRR